MNLDIFSPNLISKLGHKAQYPRVESVAPKLSVYTAFYCIKFAQAKGYILASLMVVHLAKKTPEEISGSNICIDHTFYQQ